MRIQLSDHFSYGRLLRLTLPSITMMIFTSIYSIVDGLFVSNVVGTNALSSINIIMPLNIVIGAFGFMLGTGGSAEVAKTLGQGDRQKANSYFTMIIFVITALGILLSALGIIFIRPISYFLGASDLLIEDCVVYGRIVLCGSTFFMLQTAFQTFFMTGEKAKLGLWLTIGAGVTNMVLDYVFVMLLNMGIAGAAWATVVGCALGGLVPIFYFAFPNKSLLRLSKIKLYPKVLLQSCFNGSSEMLSNLSMSLITFLYNWQMMRLVGEDGVAAITVISYITFVFIAVFIGFAMGVAPVVGFNYGAENKQELKNVFKKSLVIAVVLGVIMTLLSEVFSDQAVGFFVNKNPELAAMASRGNRIYTLSFLCCGINIFTSAFFTALCNGKVSAILSTLRMLVLQAGALIIMPYLFGLNGVWFAVVVAELIALIISIAFLIKNKKKYQY